VKKILVVVLAFVCVASVCYAQNDTLQKATKPVGEVVEQTGIFAGNIVSVVTGKTPENKPLSIVVTDDAGKTMMFPVDQTVKVMDTAVNALTLDQLKQGSKVAVEYSKDENGKEKANAITVVK